MILYDSVQAAAINLKFYRGDNYTFKIDFFLDDANEVAFDLADYAGTLKMQVKNRANNVRSLGTLEEGSGLTIVGNQLQIETTGIQSNRPSGNYYYDVEGVSSATGERTTILAGEVIVIEDVTR